MVRKENALTLMLIAIFNHYSYSLTIGLIAGNQYYQITTLSSSHVAKWRLDDTVQFIITI